MASNSVDCGNKYLGCEWKGESSDKDTHLTVCPNKLVKCPFADVGCSVSMPRNNLSEHVESFNSNHLQMLLSDQRNLKEKVNHQENYLLKEKLSTYEKELAAIKAKDEELKTELKDSEAYRDYQAERYKDAEEQNTKLTQQILNDMHKNDIQSRLLKKRLELRLDEVVSLKEKALGSKINTEATGKGALQKPFSEEELQHHTDKIIIDEFRYISKELLENISIENFERLVGLNYSLLAMTHYDNSGLLHQAIALNRLDLLKFLLEKEPDRIKDATHGNHTLLHWAAGYGRMEIVRFLLENKADVHKMDRQKKTPIDDARSNGHDEVVTILEEYAKAHPAIKDEDD